MGTRLIATPDEDAIESYRRPYCACCGLSYTNPKFGGKVLIANPPGKHGRVEIIFCQKCSSTESAQQIYKDIMAIEKNNLIIVPTLVEDTNG